MKQKKPMKKIPLSPKNNNALRPFLILILIALILSLLLPYIKDSTTYIDNDIALNTLEQNFVSGLYSEVLIDGNKAIATLSGETIETGGKEKIVRDIVILPSNDSLKDL